MLLGFAWPSPRNVSFLGEALLKRESEKMGKLGWLNRLQDWIDDRWFDLNDWLARQVHGLQRALEDAGPRTRRTVGALATHPQLVTWLTLFAAVAATVATYYSYKASQQSADVSAKAQAFAEKTSQDQIALARPVLSVMGGRFDSWTEGEGIHRQVQQRLELTIRNSGARSALPAWVAIYQVDRADPSRRSKDIYTRQLAQESPDIPSSTDVKVLFNIGRADQPPANLLVALGYGDDAPRPTGVVPRPDEPVLQKRCVRPKVVWLRAARAPQGAASAPADWLITSAAPQLLVNKKVPRGQTEAEAAADHLWLEMHGDLRCSITEMATPG